MPNPTPDAPAPSAPPPTELTFLRNDLDALARSASRERLTTIRHLKRTIRHLDSILTRLEAIAHEQRDAGVTHRAIRRLLEENTSKRRLSRIVYWEVFAGTLSAMILFVLLPFILLFTFGFGAVLVRIFRDLLNTP